MKTVKAVLSEHRSLAGSLRILTGATYSGKRAIYLSGTPEGLRLLAELLIAQADAPRNEFSKLDRAAGELFFTTDDSVDTFEMHGTDHYPEKHQPVLA
ncbi:MAG: hypothetical protein PHC88_01340 [Terrimicrobiaceae bacterium]|nr:hypothetical protein [Terrimicrobiaceae bacterium]